MHKLFLPLTSLAFAFSLVNAGCAPQVTVEGGANDAQYNPGVEPIPNPYTPTTPRPSGGAPANIVAPGAPGKCEGPELHVVGIYDPYDSATDEQGPARVHIARPGAIKLFLSSYSATDWKVTADSATQIVSIVAHAYEPVTVDAPVGVPVEMINASDTGIFLGCGYEYPDMNLQSGCETPDLITAIEQQMGQQVLSFHGCYAASDFDIRPNLVSSSNCATQMGYAHTSMVSTSCAPRLPPNPDVSNGCTGKSGVGNYEGFFCNSSLYSAGSPFLQTKNISCEDARANCALNAEANAATSVQCLWNGNVIFAAGTQSYACGQ